MRSYYQIGYSGDPLLSNKNFQTAADQPTDSKADGAKDAPAMKAKVHLALVRFRLCSTTTTE